MFSTRTITPELVEIVVCKRRKAIGALEVVAALAVCTFATPGANAQGVAKSGKPDTKPDTKNTLGAKSGAKSVPANKPPVSNLAVAPKPVQLAYQFTPGATYRYRLSALFDGHIPPFAQPDSPPIHIKVDLVYVATVKKVDKTGATVEFSVDSSDLSLYDHEIKEDEKFAPEQMTPFPLPLEDVQKALNATAVLRPDGSVASILTASSVKVQLDVGFDIRKLFLMLMPVTLSNQPVKAGDMWMTTDGILGSKAGRIAYTNKFTNVTRKGKEADYALNQTATSIVEDKLNKDGNSTTDPNEVYRTLTGKIDLSGSMILAAPVGAMSGPMLGQVQSAHILMNANVNRKRVKIDPDHPEILENDPLDVKARITIARDTPATKPGKTSVAETDPKSKSGKPAVPNSGKSVVPNSSKSALPGDKTAARSK